MNPDGRKYSPALKLTALLSVVRWYNIILISLAQYLAAVFIMNDAGRWVHTLADWRLHLIVLASGLTIASGFIINNFYDWEKDLINRPAQTLFERILSKGESLNFYLLFNTIASAIGLFMSWRAFLFFVVYAAGFWLYSHKLKKITLIGNLTAATLAVLPFFAVFFYYGLHRVDVVLYVNFIVFIEVIRSLTKDVEALKGDVLYGYPTLPAVWGIPKTSQLIYGLIAVSFMPAAMFALIHGGAIRYVPLFLAALVALGAFFIRPAGDGLADRYGHFHTLIKVVLVLSVFAIPLFGSTVEFSL